MTADQAIMTDSSSGKAERRCEQCSQAMEVSSTGRPKRYCSTRCKQAFYRSTWTDERLARAKAACKSYYERNASEMKAYSRAYYRANRDARHKSDAAYYARNRAAKTEWQRAWTARMKAERPDEYAAFLVAQRMRSRRRAAERAMALLLLPVQSLEAN